jgi:hypothetical protein
MTMQKDVTIKDIWEAHQKWQDQKSNISWFLDERRKERPLRAILNGINDLFSNKEDLNFIAKVVPAIIIALIDYCFRNNIEIQSLVNNLWQEIQNNDFSPGHYLLGLSANKPPEVNNGDK